MNIGFKTAMDIDHGYNADAREESAELQMFVNADELFINTETAAVYDVRSAGVHSFRDESNAHSIRDQSHSQSTASSTCCRRPSMRWPRRTATARATIARNYCLEQLTQSTLLNLLGHARNSALEMPFQGADERRRQRLHTGHGVHLPSEQPNAAIPRDAQ